MYEEKNSVEQPIRIYHTYSVIFYGRWNISYTKQTLGA